MLNCQPSWPKEAPKHQLGAPTLHHHQPQKEEKNKDIWVSFEDRPLAVQIIFKKTKHRLIVPTFKAWQNAQRRGKRETEREVKGKCRYPSHWEDKTDALFKDFAEGLYAERWGSQWRGLLNSQGIGGVGSEAEHPGLIS